jgi:hypothetical protein
MPRFGLALLASVLIGRAAFACSVPVFRYALERWQPSRYELIVYHRGPLSTTDGDAVHRLEAAGQRANIRIVDADLAGSLDANLKDIWDHEGKDAPLPRLVLRYPDSGPKVPSVWSGPLTVDTVTLLDSPARRAIFDQLTSGRAGAIILLVSGDQMQDDAARTFLRQHVPAIVGPIQLPQQTEEGPQIASPVPLRIDFPVVEVLRSPGEEWLVRILLGSEDGLIDVKGPIAFPVFGRGRALCSLHDNELREPTELRRSLEFICKACSCQVKELNPGVDLLMAANWDIIFDAERGPMPRIAWPPAAEPHPGSPDQSAVELRSRPPSGYEAVESAPAASSTQTTRMPMLRLGTIGAIILVLITGSWAFRGRRPTPPPGS